MFECDVHPGGGDGKDGRPYVAGTYLLNFMGGDERFPTDVGVCLACLRAEWRRGGGLHRAVWRFLNRAAGSDLPFPGIPKPDGKTSAPCVGCGTLTREREQVTDGSTRSVEPLCRSCSERRTGP